MIGGFRELAVQRRGFAEVPPRGLQIERQAVPGEERVAASPRRVGHRAWLAVLDFGRRGGGGGFVAHAADQRKRGLVGEHVGRIGAVERGMADDGARQAVGGGEFVDPSRFGNGIGSVPLGFHIDGADDVEAGRVAPVVVRHVVAADRGVIAVAERNPRQVAQPGQVVAQVPEVLVGVDQFHRVGRKPVDSQGTAATRITASSRAPR